MTTTNDIGVTRRTRARAPKALLAQAHENYLTAERAHYDAAQRASDTRDYRDVAAASSAYLVLQLARGQFREARTAARRAGQA